LKAWSGDDQAALERLAEPVDPELRLSARLFYRTEDQQIMGANYMVKGDSFIPERSANGAASGLA
jgi:hypothetical protein